MVKKFLILEITRIFGCENLYKCRILIFVYCFFLRKPFNLLTNSFKII
jgi:hypothetical protein